jgi:hypothetical protein
MPYPFELFPRTEKQAKFVVISLGLIFVGFVVAGAFYGRDMLKLFAD